MNPFWEVADFVRRLRREMRFGELSRAPLRLLRLDLEGERLTCDWIARPADAWEEGLDWRQREQSVSEQALRDAIRMRDLTFDVLPNIEAAVLRSFRFSNAREPPELIIRGMTLRAEPPIWRVSSLVMRAKLCGFQFQIEDGILQSLEIKEEAVLEIMKERLCEGVTPDGEGGC